MDTLTEIQEMRRGVQDSPRDVYLTVKVSLLDGHNHSNADVMVWLHDLIAYANEPFETADIEVRLG